jgi:signal transduction histidine kinase
MTEASARRLAKGLFAAFVLLLTVSVVFHVLATSAGIRSTSSLASGLGFLVMGSLFPIVGVILATRRPENALGWIMLVIGLFVVEPAEPIGEWLIATGHPGGLWALAGDQFSWVPVIGLAGIYVLLLFPDGHLPSPRWRWFAWTVGIGMVITSFAIQFSPGNLADAGYPNLRTPYAIPALRPVIGVAFVALATIPLGIIGAAISLVFRYRRAGGTERLQIRWLASAAVIVAVLYAIAMALSLASSVGWASGGGVVSFLQNVAVISFVLIPISIGFAVLRYRLYEIDVVIRMAVIVGAIALVFTAVYVAVVGGIGALVEAHSTTALSFVAAAVVAILFQPVLRRTRRLADRIVYGRRATPYEVLSDFSERLGGTYSAEDVLPRMARVVAEGVGASRAFVWAKADGRLRVAAAWPSNAERPDEMPLTGNELPKLPNADAAYAIEHQGELLGALSVSMPASDPIDEAKSKLISDLAGQAGLVLRNVGLTAELQRRLEDLQAAQRRIVTAQDHERRKLERNIHDGAQQQLVALTVKLRLAEQLAERDPGKTRETLAALQQDTQAALEDLRDLARGIYPPLLADRGLAAALEAQARKSPVPVEIAPDGAGRYDPATEAAVYFSCLEALQNVAKYAEASRAVVELAHHDGRLTFTVSDDGRGFDPGATGYGTGLQGIADRLAALDGTLQVRSEVGRGTTLVGTVPVSEREA